MTQIWLGNKAKAKKLAEDQAKEREERRKQFQRSNGTEIGVPEFGGSGLRCQQGKQFLQSRGSVQNVWQTRMWSFSGKIEF